MTQVHFTLNNEEVQSIIEHSVKDDVSKNIWVFGLSCGKNL
ncbi:transposase [Enterococcus faecium]|nr:transposase [Enterococcus faecium]